MSQELAPSSDPNEFARGWPIILGSALGIGVGIMALPFSTAGLFFAELQQEFGWSRTALSLGPTILLSIVALLAPAVGWLADRISPLVIIGVSLAAVGCAFLLFSRMDGDIYVYYLICAGMAVVGAGASTVVFARVVCTGFHRQRGLALGLVMAGNGVTAILSPILLGPLISEQGWRGGYVALAAVLFVAAPIILILLFQSQRRERLKHRAFRESDDSGFSRALATPHFWMMGVAFLLGTLATTGMVVHFVPFLTDAGVDMRRAAATASIIGVGLIGGRLLTGWLMDRFPAHRVGAAMMVASSAGLVVLALGGSSTAPIGALAIGLCIGAELDVIGYLTGYYFGLGSYGRIYGALYMLCAGGTALSPMYYGLAIDHFGDYTSGLLLGAAMLAASAILLFTLPGQPSPGFEAE